MILGRYSQNTRALISMGYPLCSTDRSSLVKRFMNYHTHVAVHEVL